MKKIILAVLILPLLATYSKGSDQYEIGETLYIWAKNGMNLRAGPGTDFKIITKLGFGEELEVKEKTEKTYNVLGISGAEKINGVTKKIDPLIFKGHWVQVLTRSGEIGYLIDQYLLSVQPEKIKEPPLYTVNLMLLSVDTIYKSPIIHDGGGLNQAIEWTFLEGIKLTDSSGGYWSETTFVFPDYTVEEALIMLSSSWMDYKNMVVLKNWKDEILISDNEICGIKVKRIGNEVRIVLSCSC